MAKIAKNKDINFVSKLDPTKYKKLTVKEKKLIEKAVKKFVIEYGETLRLLGEK